MRVKLKEAFDLQMGKTPARNNAEFWNGTHKWISIADLGNAGKYIDSTKEGISDAGVEASGIKIVPKGTVIMSFKLSIGKTAITSADMYTNEAIMAFHSKRTYEIDVDYLYHLCCGTNWCIGTNKAVMGLTLNKATLSEYEIELPNISEQREIARKLDKLDSIIARRKAQLVTLEELVKSRFLELFGDLADPKCQWKKEKLVDVCKNPDDIKCGPFGTQLSKDDYCISGVAVWEIPQINSGFATQSTHFLSDEKANQLEAYSIKSGDIAMSRKGNVGRCAVFPETMEDGIIHSDVLRIRINNELVLPVFMMHQLHYSRAVQHQIELVSSGAIMAGINVTKLKQIEVHIPPMEFQQQFAVFVSQVDKSKHLQHIALRLCHQMTKIYEQERMSCQILSF